MTLISSVLRSEATRVLISSFIVPKNNLSANIPQAPKQREGRGGVGAWGRGGVGAWGRGGVGAWKNQKTGP